MAAFIKLKTHLVPRQWHVGEPVPEEAELVEWIQADCDELGVILDKFINLPRCDDRVQIWYGDHAKFIVGNVHNEVSNASNQS